MLSKHPEKAKTYEKTFQTYVEKEYAKKLTPEEAAIPTQKRWFLPHHAVIHPKKRKFRVVFDAASSFHGVSLNSQLMSGPDYLQKLPGILLRFRQEPVSVIADVEAMYHQVRIASEDQPALSFLWREKKEEPPDVYQMNVNIFGALCSAAIACYALRKTAQDQDVTIEVKNAILKNFYMDDFIHSELTPNRSTEMLLDVAETVSRGGFHLTKFMSNSREVLSALPPAELAIDQATVSTGKLPCQRTLGVLWDAETDEIGIDFPKNEPKSYTRRELLKLVSCVFDPFGLVAPFLVSAKIMMQHTWTKKLAWDTILPKEDVARWKVWVQELPLLSEVRIPRCYKTSEEPGRRELHLFCDASEKAFAAVAYFRGDEG